MNYKTVPIKIGRIHQGTASYAIVADGYPVFGFGKTLADAHIHWLQACYAYMRHAPLNNGVEFHETEHEERLLFA